ncbi:M48 family metallopeptidase [bacterium]|nr:M48 family metallopeptidase [bacterium]
MSATRGIRFLAALIAVALACAVPAQAGLFKISRSNEISLGRDFYKDYARKHDYLDETPEGAHVKRVGQRLVQRNAVVDYDFTFTLVDDEEVNAFAVPGGYVFINRGLYDYVSYDDGMLACILGHEMGHVLDRHYKKMYEDYMKAQLGIIVAGIAIGGREGADVANALSLGGNLVFLKYSRDDEEHADRWGIELAYGAGYDPYGMARSMRLFSRLENKLTQTELFDLWRTHPRPQERVARCRKIARELSGKEEYEFYPPIPPEGSPLYEKPAVIIRELPEGEGAEDAEAEAVEDEEESEGDGIVVKKLEDEGGEGSPPQARK